MIMMLWGRRRLLSRIGANLVSGVWAFALFVAMFSVVLNVPIVWGSGTIYIRADGSIDPPTAPIQRNGDIYILTGNIVGEGISIQRNNMTLHGGGYSVQGTRTGSGVSLWERSNVTVKGIEIREFSVGIMLSYSTNNSVYSNTLTSNANYGIELYHSSVNNIFRNSFSQNGGSIYGYGPSDENSICENTITNDYYGIGISGSSTCISQNKITVHFEAIQLSSSSDSNIRGNNVTSAGLKGIILSGSSNNNLSENIVSNTNYGITLGGSNNNSLTNNTISDSTYAVYFGASDNNNLDNNNASLNSIGYGIYFDSSNNNTINNNVISNNQYGINAILSLGNIIRNNKITNNSFLGVALGWSSYNNITANDIINNGNYGIELYASSDHSSINGNNITSNEVGVLQGSSQNNTMFRNNIRNNVRGIWLVNHLENSSILENNIVNNSYGVYLDSSSNNEISHNNFINNRMQFYTNNSVNVWDSGYPSGGNYWSDYSGTDIYSGPNQDMLGSDGIVDTPFLMDANNKDNYPLMSMWGNIIDAEPPVAEAGPDLTINAGTTVTFNGSKSIDDFAIKSYVWTFTDVASQILTGMQPKYTFNNPGDFEVTLNVSDYADKWDTDTVTITVELPEHELVASITAPASLQRGTSSTLKGTVTNSGPNDATSVGLVLLINGTTVDSTTIPILQVGNSFTLSYLWTPAVEGTYNVTVYVHPVLGEVSIENNRITKIVTVALPPPPPKVKVGVKTGDWVRLDYTITGAPSGTLLPEWIKIEFLSVEGTTANVRVTMHMSDGTEPSQTMTVDVAVGSGTFQGLSGFVIPANCTTGDSVYISGYGNVTIDGETTRTYAGASRTVVYANFSQLGSQLTYYWDKQTGVMVEASTTSGGITGTAKATETNMWQAQQTGLPFDQTYLYILVAGVIVIAVGSTAFVMRRKKKHPEIVTSTAPTS